MSLTLKDLKNHIRYDPNLGLFYRPETGEIAGTVLKGGGRRYHEICIKGKPYHSHRLAFLYMNGEMPKNQVDHINGDSFDNRWENLREVTIAENNKNKSIHKNNTSGVNGVHWSARDEKWKAQINTGGKRIHIGYYEDIVDAVLERLEAELKYGFHCNHGRKKICL